LAQCSGMQPRESPPCGALLPWLLVAALPRWDVAATGSPAEEETAGGKCSELDDANGRWEGSRKVGGKYTLRCARGFQVSGRHGYRSGTISCPENLEWPEELKCEDIDNCDQLKHGCGPKGICVDLVDGYECNCEKGYPPRKSRDGETVCGDEADMRICGGNTCGPFGLCIDLKGKFPDGHDKDDLARAGHEHRPFRCECADGFADNGTTCLRRDCGALHDELGTWTGSTLFNQEYTLRCPDRSFVWGYPALRDITIRCTRRGDWLSPHPVCHSPSREAEDAELESLRFWSSLGCAVLCVCSAALAAGLTLGLATLEPFGLTVVMATSEEHCRTKEAKEKLRRDQDDAGLVLPLVRDHHRLLVTLMLFNTVANEALPIFLDELVPSWAAVLISVTAVLICGEILPSAIFTGPSQMRIAGTCVPLVKLLQWLFHYIATPIIALLDRLIEQEDAEGSVKYSRAELRALLQLHGHRAGGEEEELHGHHGHPGAEGTATAAGSGAAATVGGALACFLGQHLPAQGGPPPPSREVRPEAEGHDAVPSVLAGSELQLINGALDLQDVSLDRVPYARRRQCVVGGRDDSAADLLAQDLLDCGQRSVLVLGDACPERWSGLRRASTGSLRCPLVKSRDVVGCLCSRDVVQGGKRALGSLCAGPLVLVPDHLSALEALRLLAAAGSSLGIVTHGTGEQGTVQGVISRSEILSTMLLSRRRAHSPDSGHPRGAVDHAESLDFEEPPAGPPVLPTPSRRHVGHRPLLTRCPSTLDPMRSGPLRGPARSATVTSFEDSTANATERRASA